MILKKNFAIVVSSILLAGMVSFSLGAFFTTFDGSISSDQNTWGALGSYLSGTVGVFAACLAVIWLMISVHLQKNELSHLKAELEKSSEEQKKQTHISALTAILNSSTQALSQYQSNLIALNSGEAHLHPFDDPSMIHMSMDEEFKKMSFYQEKVEAYLLEKYVVEKEPVIDSKHEHDPF